MKKDYSTNIQVDTDLLIRKDQLAKSILLLRALKLPVSRMILQSLSAGQSMTVQMIEYHIRTNYEPKIRQSEVSTHLGKLRRHKVVTYTLDGKEHWYQVDFNRLQKIIHSLNKFLYGKD